MNDITAIILTKNEELNIKRCINSIISVVDRIVVVDSGSTDKTTEIAAGLGAEIYRHEPFVHYAAQFNWALDNVEIRTKWVFRFDADEVLPHELAEEMVENCRVHRDDDVNGFVMKYKVFFMGRFLSHGGAYPFCKITVFKNGLGRFEDRAMGEHVVLSEGTSITLQNDCLHYDFKNLNTWIQKHNWYAEREVQDYYAALTEEKNTGHLYREAKVTRKLRNSLYYRLPKFLRARLYYWYRYYFQLGFLDGEAGKVYAFLQAYWYRYLIDAKIVEKELEEQKRTDK